MLVEETPDNASMMPFLSLRVRLARFFAERKSKQVEQAKETQNIKAENLNTTH